MDVVKDHRDLTPNKKTSIATFKNGKSIQTQVKNKNFQKKIVSNYYEENYSTQKLKKPKEEAKSNKRESNNDNYNNENLKDIRSNNTNNDNNIKKHADSGNVPKDNKVILLETILKYLDTFDYYKVFLDNQIYLNDFLLITRQDLVELNLPIGKRNRVLAFAEKYKNYAKDFTLEEIHNFFNMNKSLNINNTSTNKDRSIGNLVKKEEKRYKDKDLSENLNFLQDQIERLREKSKNKDNKEQYSLFGDNLRESSESLNFLGSIRNSTITPTKENEIYKKTKKMDTFVNNSSTKHLTNSPNTLNISEILSKANTYNESKYNKEDTNSYADTYKLVKQLSTQNQNEEFNKKILGLLNQNREKSNLDIDYLYNKNKGNNYEKTPDRKL